MKLPALVLLVAAAGAAPAAAQEAPAPEPAKPVRVSMTLAGGALAPVGGMRDTYQDGLVAGLRLGLRSRIGLGAFLAVDYSPLPRRQLGLDAYDTTYGTVALVPAWTIGSGTVRLQLGAGGGVALERVEMVPDAGPVTTTQGYEPAALGQVGVEVHVARGGGLVLLAGATRTFGEREYQYAWGMGGLTLEF